MNSLTGFQYFKCSHCKKTYQDLKIETIGEMTDHDKVCRKNCLRCALDGGE